MLKTKSIKTMTSHILFLMLMFSAGSALSTAYDPIFLGKVTDLRLPLNQTRVLELTSPISKISLGNPDVADVLVLGSRRIYVLGKSLGSTNVVVWDKNETSYTSFSVEVIHNIDELKKTIHELMPDENPQIRSTEGAILLSGEVSSSAKVDAIHQLSTQFVANANKYSLAHKEDKKIEPTSVINLLQVGGPHQVMLEVKIVELSRSVMKRLGINMAGFSPRSGNGRWSTGVVNGGATFPNALTPIGGNTVPIFPNNESWLNGNNPIIGPNVDTFEPTTPAVSAAGLFASFLSGGSVFNLVIDASKEDGLAKILAEPTLTTMSGEPASFLSGGEFPVPMWDGDSDRISIIFKEYGISVKVLPTVLDSDRINLSLNISVSELSNAASITAGIQTAAVNFSIPSLSTRSATSTVELMDGQTIGIAGLISDKMRESVTKFPGLGDIPILGALFRSQEYIQDKSELVMFVTAHLAKPIAPSQIRLPTDSFVEPSDARFFLMGQLEGDPDDAIINKKQQPGMEPELATNSTEKINQPHSGSGPTFGHEL